MQKFHYDYKYDIAITIPIYKIGKERIKTYLQEIKDTFDGYSYQIVLSDNRPIDRRDCDLSEFDDDVVSHVDNGGNIYAFGARRSAFYATEAFFIWSIDDDNCIKSNGKHIVPHLLSQNNTIEADKASGSIGVNWCLSSSVRKFYDSITNERLPTVCFFEDIILQNFTVKNEQTVLLFPELLEIYDPDSVDWVVYNDWVDRSDRDKTHVNINYFIQGVESLIDFDKSYEKFFMYYNVLTVLKNFKFTDEDFFILLNHSVEMRKVIQNTISQYKLINQAPWLNSINVQRLRNKFHYDYKYDIAITIPIYKIGKERIKTYLQEIKNTFDGYSYQIVLSDNRPIDRRDCDLSEFDDDVVSHVDCGTDNVYTFRTRMSAFYATEAFFIWSIDDDNCMNPNGKYIVPHLLSQDHTIEADSDTGSIGVNWCLSSSVRKFYDSITDERLPTVCFEDVILQNFTVKNEQTVLFFPGLLEIYKPDSEAWVFCDDSEEWKRTHVNINHFIQGIESFIDFKAEKVMYYHIATILRNFRFTDEDFNILLEDCTKDFVNVLANYEDKIKEYELDKTHPWVFNINSKRLLEKMETKDIRNKRIILRLIKGLPHAVLLANVVTPEEKIICIDDVSYNFFKEIGLTNEIVRYEEFLNPYHSKIKYLLQESIENPNAEILFLDAGIHFKDKKFTKLRYEYFKGILSPTYEQVYNGKILGEVPNMPIAKIMIANNCDQKMLIDYMQKASQKRIYSNIVYHYYNTNCKGFGLEEQVMIDADYCRNGDQEWKYNLRLFNNVLYNHSVIYDNISANNQNLHLKYFEYLQNAFTQEEVDKNSSKDIADFWSNFWDKGLTVKEYAEQNQKDGTIIT